MTQGLVILSKNTGYREINGNAWVLVFFLPPEGHFFFLALDPDTLADLLDVPYGLFIMRMGSWGLYPGWQRYPWPDEPRPNGPCDRNSEETNLKKKIILSNSSIKCKVTAGTIHCLWQPKSLATKIASDLCGLSFVSVGSLCHQWRERLLQGMTQGGFRGKM